MTTGARIRYVRKSQSCMVSLQAHTAWWAAYWPQSFVSFEPTRAEGFYYTQMCVYT